MINIDIINIKNLKLIFYVTMHYSAPKINKNN